MEDQKKITSERDNRLKQIQRQKSLIFWKKPKKTDQQAKDEAEQGRRMINQITTMKIS